MDDKPRCKWCNLRNPRYVTYHDNEWGRAEHDDRRLFEMLVLECFQAGLSWECILNKREAFRRAFDKFNYVKVAAYNEAKIASLLNDEGIVRHRQKIEAAIANARVFMKIQREYGSFDEYIWALSSDEKEYESKRYRSSLPELISSDLRHRGMKFVGVTTVRSFLEAIGMISGHEEGCWMHGKNIDINT